MLTPQSEPQRLPERVVLALIVLSFPRTIALRLEVRTRGTLPDVVQIHVPDQPERVVFQTVRVCNLPVLTALMAGDYISVMDTLVPRTTCAPLLVVNAIIAVKIYPSMVVIRMVA